MISLWTMTTPESTPPGWYDDGSGQQRWWDGNQWGQYASQVAPSSGSGGDPKTMAVLAQVLGLITGFIGPLIIYLVNGEKDAYIRHHAAESLNFQLTLLIGYIISFVLFLVIIGIVILPVLIVLGIIFPIIAAVAANRGEWYRYPISIRMVPGAVG